MGVSVVIPVYNEEKSLAACLDSLKNQEEMPDEIIVVNNNSTDSTVEVAKRFNVRILSETKQGTSFARNTGFNAAKYDIIARTDADSQVPPDWIKRIKSHFIDPTVVAVSGPAFFSDFLPQVFQYKQPIFRCFFTLAKLKLGHNMLFGPNMAVRKTAWEQIKDKVCTSDKDVHEDIDVAVHLHSLGKIDVDPSLVVKTSFRRWKKHHSYLDYSRRFFTTTNHKKERYV
jgi:glycosyltransferase involved in cell wall biosynthesis